VDDEFCLGMPDDLKGSSTNTETIDILVDGDQSVAHTVASRTQKNKQASLESSMQAFQSIASTLATKEAREANEDLKKGRLELMRMKDISPQMKKKVKTKLLTDYSIELSPCTHAPTTSRKQSLASTDMLTLTAHDSNSHESDGDIYN
jgi:hypothetical protein